MNEFIIAHSKTVAYSESMTRLVSYSTSRLVKLLVVRALPQNSPDDFDSLHIHLVMHFAIQFELVF